MTDPRSQYFDLTSAIAEKAEPPAQGQIFIRDARLPGFALRITAAGTKTWIVEARVKGRKNNGSCRRTLGRYPNISADRARKLAIKELGNFAEGQDTLSERRSAQQRDITLEQVFTDYLAGRDLKPTSVSDYRRAFDDTFDDWRDKPIISITRSMVEKRHQLTGEKSHARANLSMRLLRALFRFAIGKYEDSDGQPVVVDNPVIRLNATRSWFRIERRRRLIRLHQFRDWFDGLDVLRNRGQPTASVVADWLEFLVLTGCRKTESLNLQWRDVNLSAAFFCLPDTKNREVHELPLSDRLLEILTARQADHRNNPFVFPRNPTGKQVGDMKPLTEPRKWMNTVTEHSGVEFTAHDLRRTFATVAESLDIPRYTLKRLMNHSSNSNNDVTAGYLQIDVERLRVPMQRITDEILRAAGRGSTARLTEQTSRDKFLTAKT